MTREILQEGEEMVRKRANFSLIILLFLSSLYFQAMASGQTAKANSSPEIDKEALKKLQEQKVV